MFQASLILRWVLYGYNSISLDTVKTRSGKAYEAAYTGDINSGAVLLGQSIGIIKSLESVEKIVEEIVQDAEKRLINAHSFIK